jgi:hypothetical protein
MGEVTTIKIFQETKSRLNKLKEYEKESYDQILRKTLHILNICRKNPLQAKKILEDIEAKSTKKENVYEKKGIY